METITLGIAGTVTSNLIKKGWDKLSPNGKAITCSLIGLGIFIYGISQIER